MSAGPYPWEYPAKVHDDGANIVFCDGHVGRAVQRREPLLLAYPHSQASWCVKRLARAILDGSGGPRHGRFAFFRGLANVFLGGNR